MTEMLLTLALFYYLGPWWAIGIVFVYMIGSMIITTWQITSDIKKEKNRK